MAETIGIEVRDGLWSNFQTTEVLGGVGVRLVGEGSVTEGGHTKRPRLLLRRRRWPQEPGNRDEKAPKLEERKAAEDADRYELLKLEEVNYRQGSKDAKVPADFFQQDVTGVEPLSAALEQGLRDGKPARFWELLGRAAAALEAYCAGITAEAALPVQLPASLGLNKGGRIVLLDGELAVTGDLPPDCPAARLYRDAALPVKQCKAGEFDALHAAALRRFAEDHGESSRTQAPGLAELRAKKPLTLAALREFCAEQAKRGNAPVAVPVPTPVPPKPVRPPVVPLPAPVPVIEAPKLPPKEILPLAEVEPEPARGWRGWLVASMLVNALLLAALIGGVVWFLTQSSEAKDPPGGGGSAGLGGGGPNPGKGSGANGDASKKSTPVPPEYHTKAYYVYLPTRGSKGVKIKEVVAKAYPGDTVHDLTGDAAAQTLLEGRRDAAHKRLLGDAGVKAVLKKVNRKARFSGYNDEGPALSDGFFDLYGSFEHVVLPADGAAATPSGTQQKTESSLMQPDGVELLHKLAPLNDDDRAALATIRQEIADYAALQDAVASTGGRPAYLVEVPRKDEPARYVTYAELLNRQELPKFLNRARMRLATAVSPDEQGSGGVSAESLTLSRQGYFRQVGPEDRRFVAWSQVSDGNKDQTLWRGLAPNKKVEWARLTLPLCMGGTRDSVSFDVAVETGGKAVVLFRNQKHRVTTNSDNKEKAKKEAEKEAREYLVKVLKIDSMDIHRLIQTNETSTGAVASLAYERLADYFVNYNVKLPGNVERLTREKFNELMDREKKKPEKDDTEGTGKPEDDE